MNFSEILMDLKKNFVVIIPSLHLVVVRLGVTHNRNFSLANLVKGICELLPDQNENNIVSKTSNRSIVHSQQSSVHGFVRLIDAVMFVFNRINS